MATPGGHYDVISPRYLPRRAENEDGASSSSARSALSIPINSAPKQGSMEKKEGEDKMTKTSQPGVDESGEFVLANEIVRALSAGGLDKYAEVFTQEEIDLESFLMLNDTDLRNMNIPTGTLAPPPSHNRIPFQIFQSMHTKGFALCIFRCQPFAFSFCL
jgi:hypothetical protein